MVGMMARSLTTGTPSCNKQETRHTTSATNAAAKGTAQQPREVRHDSEVHAAALWTSQRRGVSGGAEEAATAGSYYIHLVKIIDSLSKPFL
jgi:hypothetical protein